MTLPNKPLYSVRQTCRSRNPKTPHVLSLLNAPYSSSESSTVAPTVASDMSLASLSLPTSLSTHSTAFIPSPLLPNLTPLHLIPSHDGKLQQQQQQQQQLGNSSVIRELEKVFRVDTMPSDEIHQRRAAINSHSMLSMVMNRTMELYRAPMTAAILKARSGIRKLDERVAEFDSGEYLRLQGFDLALLALHTPISDAHREALLMANQLFYRFLAEREKLDMIFGEMCTRVITLLQEQSLRRPVLEDETQMRMICITGRFHDVYRELIDSFQRAVNNLKAFHLRNPRKPRLLGQQATQILQKWFDEHLHDPYPTDREKATLAEECSLSVSQVNYWFGNKRARYKRKLTSPSDDDQENGQEKRARTSSDESDEGIPSEAMDEEQNEQ